MTHSFSSEELLLLGALVEVHPGVQRCSIDRQQDGSLRVYGGGHMWTIRDGRLQAHGALWPITYGLAHAQT